MCRPRFDSAVTTCRYSPTRTIPWTRFVSHHFSVERPRTSSVDIAEPPQRESCRGRMSAASTCRLVLRKQGAVWNSLTSTHTHTHTKDFSTHPAPVSPTVSENSRVARARLPGERRTDKQLRVKYYKNIPEMRKRSNAGCKKYDVGLRQGYICCRFWQVD